MSDAARSPGSTSTRTGTTGGTTGGTPGGSPADRITVPARTPAGADGDRSPAEPTAAPEAGGAGPLRYPFPDPGALAASPEWAQLREGCPVAPVRLDSGDLAVLLTRYDDVRGLLSDPRFARNLDADDAARLAEAADVFAAPPLYAEDPADRRDPDGATATEASSTTSGTAPAARAASTAAPAASHVAAGHARWRRQVSRAFTARQVTALVPRIEQVAHELVDDLLAAGPPADLYRSLGFPLPVFVICDLLGVPAQQRDRFAHWSEAFLNLTRFTREEVDAARAELQEFMVGHVRSKRENPQDDLLSELAAIVDAEDGRLSEQELVITGQGLLVAGHETTANMIIKMVAMLLADRAHWDRLLADRSLVPTAVEEVLRFDPVRGFGLPRYLSEEVAVGNTLLGKGTTVLSCLSAANRDPGAFTDADRLVLDRSPNPHLAFGAGPYSCLGQSLARVELQTVLSVLLDRVPDLELAVAPEELQRRQGLVVGGLECLPVRW